MPVEKLRYTLLEIEVVGGIKITQSGLMKWLYVVLYLLGLWKFYAVRLNIIEDLSIKPHLLSDIAVRVVASRLKSL
jgi:hypothetical protein